uniref:Uncharacterized protein n=1 Tax=Lygus hesperus TaxID=30085 RepID=A0A0A9VQK6_LYGHE
MVKSKASKRSQKSNRSNASQCTDEIVQCPHLHFKSDVIDRNVLSKEQHLNLLSTPKGYRWEEASDKKEDGQGEGTENLPTHLPRRVVCSGRRMKKPEKVYVHNFLAEVWTFLTPEMIDRLKGMLMNEFGMSPQEADQLVNQQRESNILNSSTVSLYKRPRRLAGGSEVHDSIAKLRSPKHGICNKHPMPNIGKRNSDIKQISNIISEKISSYIMDTMCSSRNMRQQEIAQTLVKRLNHALDENVSMETPRTNVHKAMVVLADKLSLWLDRVGKASY